ncbi:MULTISPECIES: hypothetical protein [Pseudomonas]|jgi:hypothetical protein|uniref:hypothetical protein n=1 Tax=Pseudomonas TaxID=286 RepID=UPI0008768A67|nr:MULTISPECIES: hypothetical protein [Pseudomonas]MDB6445089.1 hypothetical protein [Pseudomonas sp. 21TX0197]MDT8907584.1 hypothetical protein [Pseudomonas prosekii]NHN70270.1 hypothetical protein [Pseudomonas fluorescens]ROO39195.1 hypothetical protein BIV08_18195 [Pseudomonas sp. AF76]ROO39465.1 hypothetical protein BIV09_12305 [Pseudomonas sp. 7SR1]
MNDESLTGLVTGPNLLSYIETLSLQDHNDIADCNNIATQSADLGHDRYTDAKGWFEEYARTLNFLGWALHGDSIFTRTQHLVSGSVADFLVQSAWSMRDSRQANAMIDTLDALKIERLAMLSFDNETREGESFQIIPARYDTQNNLNIAVYKLQLNVNIKKRGFLFWNWEQRSATITQQRIFLRLDRSELERKRGLIRNKLNEQSMRRFNLRRIAS